MTDPALDARRFGIACLLGLALGLYYGFLRPLRPKHTVLSDFLFLPAMPIDISRSFIVLSAAPFRQPAF